MLPSIRTGLKAHSHRARLRPSTSVTRRSSTDVDGRRHARCEWAFTLDHTPSFTVTTLFCLVFPFPWCHHHHQYHHNHRNTVCIRCLLDCDAVWIVCCLFPFILYFLHSLRIIFPRETVCWYTVLLLASLSVTCQPWGLSSELQVQRANTNDTGWI